MRRDSLCLLTWMVLVALGGVASASGPRWVTGPPYFTGQAGQPVRWVTWTPWYFTDPGDLSVSVNHASADALVAAAAAVWNVPVSGVTLGYGGALDEHVSGANAYASASGPVFPGDVQSGNWGTKQIAVIYDSDGSVTDMLLGGGASSPAECRQNAVTEDVDSITPAGYIEHAIVVLNGRCTGPAPEQQLQMQYQLERAFGRVLGLGWSQTNDNVFTQTPSPTYNQALHWPVMHPIDIICGPYTYQCMPQPFTLRDDDVASVVSLYPLLVYYSFASTPPLPGKQWSYVQASRIYGTASFATGQGMQGVNVELQRQAGGTLTPEAWYDVSGVSGYLFQRNGGNAVTGPGYGMAASMGSTDAQWEGYWEIGWVPDIDAANGVHGPMSAVLTTEAINPLYQGAYAVGPYVAGTVAPSGSAMVQHPGEPLQPNLYPWSAVQASLTPGDGATNCSPAGDGVESAPAAMAAIGWKTSLLCGHGYEAWSGFAVQAGRTATLEVTALDERGFATTAKAMPLIGVWAASDAPGTLPTVAESPSAFNTTTLGMTAVALSSAKAQRFRFAVADARGDGRPDFAYQARVLYADSVHPAATSLNGGQITVAGMGFRAGNEVLVNGIPAAVSSWTSTAILAVAPPESAFSTLPTGAVDVAVVDLSTGGRTVMSGALTYGGVAADRMMLVSAPSGTVAVGSAAAVSFTVRVVLGDGVTPVVGVPVTFSASGGAVQFGGCAAGSCLVLTDGTGLASVTVTPGTFGPVTLLAAAVGTSVTVNFNAVSRSVTAVRAVEYVAAGATVAWIPAVTVMENGVAAAGVSVGWTGSAGLALAGSSVSDASGVATGSAVPGPVAAGVSAGGQGCAWTGSVCAAFSVVGVDASALRVSVVSGAGQGVGSGSAFAQVVVVVTDGAGHPVAGAPVAIHQVVDAAEMACPVRGRCAVAPMLEAQNTAATSDADGLVTVSPLQLFGVAGVTNIAVATGTRGFVSLALVAGP